MCGWPDSQEILLWINVFALALPHAGCLQDSEKWLDYEWQNGGRLFSAIRRVMDAGGGRGGIFTIAITCPFGGILAAQSRVY